MKSERIGKQKLSWHSKVVVVALMLMRSLSALSQSYPVQVVCHVIPPVGVSLAEFQYPLRPKVQASLTLIDLARPSYDVRLRITIEGQSLLLRSRPTLSVPPINLRSGVPTLLDPAVLIPYFDINNLEVSGISRQAFIRSGMRLPEGPYNLCIEAIDYRRPGDRAVSNSACSPVMVAEYEPPVLLPPDLSNQLLFDQQPPVFQQALFTWQPQHFGTFPVEYELRLYRQMRGMEQLPKRIIQTQSLPYIRVRTTSTFYALSPADPPLLPGETYYGEVQIFPIGYPAIFRNQGTSELITFVLDTTQTESCTAPQEYSGHGVTAGIAIKWKTATHCDSFITESLDEKSSTYHYQTIHISANNALRDTVHEVYSGRSYVLRTGCLCEQDTAYSDTIHIDFHRPSVKIPDYACGTELGMPEPITTLLPTLQEGDTIIASDMQVIVRRATGSNGHFSGKGHLVVPYFKYARVNAVFQNITVNDEHRMIGGEMHVIGVGQNILNEDVVEGLNDLTNGLQDLSGDLGEFTGQLDSINKMRDILGDNIPPWLIDSLQLIQDLLANTSDDGLREKLEKLLDELNQQKRDWELMYINLVITLVHNKFDTCEVQKDILAGNYNQSANVFEDVSLINGPNKAPPLQTELDKKGMGEKTFAISRDELAQEYPEMTQQYTNYLTARKGYAVCAITRKIQSEIGDPDGNNRVREFALKLTVVGADIIQPLRAIFERYNWDLNTMEKHPELNDEVQEIFDNALLKLYYRL